MTDQERRVIHTFMKAYFSLHALELLCWAYSPDISDSVSSIAAQLSSLKEPLTSNDPEKEALVQYLMGDMSSHISKHVGQWQMNPEA